MSKLAIGSIETLSGVKVALDDLTSYILVEDTDEIRSKNLSGIKQIRLNTRGNPIYKLDTTDTTSVDDDFLVIVDAGGNRWKLVHNGKIKVEWSGAPVSPADSTAHFNKLLSYLSTGNLHLEITKAYDVDISGGTDPFNAFSSLMGDNITIDGGGTIRFIGDYITGIANGATREYEFAVFYGENCRVENIHFDGNGLFTQYAPSASLPNSHLRCVFFQGGISDYQKNNKVIGCTAFNGSGQAFGGQYQRGSAIIGCQVDHIQIGIGFDTSYDCVTLYNQSDNAHDAHYGMWNSFNAVIAHNRGYTSDNGNGIDCAGSIDGDILYNDLQDCANSGIWIGRDPNTANQFFRIKVKGNRLRNNETYAGDGERAEVRIAAIQYDTQNTEQGSDVTLDDNTIEAVSRGVFVGLGAHSVAIKSGSIDPANGTSFGAARIEALFADNLVIHDVRTESIEPSAWTDKIVNANASLDYRDSKRTVYEIHNGPVLVGVADGRIHGNEFALTTTDRLVGIVEYTDQVNAYHAYVKVHVSLNSGNSTIVEKCLYGISTITLADNGNSLSFSSSGQADTPVITFTYPSAGVAYIWAKASIGPQSGKVVISCVGAPMKVYNVYNQ